MSSADAHIGLENEIDAIPIDSEYKEEKGFKWFLKFSVQQIGKRPCLPILIFMVLSLIFNQWDIERDKYDGPRIIPEDSSTTGVYLRKNDKPCGFMKSKFGYYENRTCSANVLIDRRERFGCYVSDCGSPREILCSENGNGWLSKKVFSTESRCEDNTHIRHYCCRPQSQLCTWQGVWTSTETFQNINCQFEPNSECGNLLCTNGQHKILADSEGFCRSVMMNGRWGSATCGKIFSDNSDEWYKKIDAYSVIDV
ncbi:SRCR domain-containing protein [Caenorhabditis elegans]|uniref:SRCR domain-containing protein n=1 Tax=Caenorhabditis elegans TaxID=6239 RepID=A7YNZ7_CAEEL|nr:SRCR domain-containing protein [Caenorhabditis elegans]CAP03061.1 SRCR domain-containing protein [Caenorhabditis elegans]|eukprot:NP_001122470.1 Uncharacterized protein CELE_F32H2.12 [Caenorhabditis elegans]